MDGAERSARCLGACLFLVACSPAPPGGGGGPPAPDLTMTLQCKNATGDCNNDPYDGCESSLDIDRDNCGACGRSCLGGECQGSQCFAVTLDDTLEPTDIAIDEKSIYLAVPDVRIVAMAKDGSGRRDIATNENSPRRVAVDGTRVYWGGGDTRLALGGYIRSAPGDGSGAPEKVVDGINDPSALVVAGGVLYYSERGSPASSFTDGAIESIRLPSGQPQAIVARTNRPGALAVDAASVYWIDGGTVAGRFADGKIMRAPLGGGATTTIGDSIPAANDLALDGTWAYAASGGTIESGHTDGAIFRAAKSGGAGAEKLVSKANEAVGVAVAGGYVYWADRTSRAIRRVPVGGGPAETVAPTGDGAPLRVLVDDKAIYWICAKDAGTNKGEGVYRIAR